MENDERGHSLFVGKGAVVEAEYISPELPKFENNPCILALPQINTRKRALSAMQRFPDYERDPLNFPAHLRTHFVMDLLHFFQPLPIHLRLEGMISRMIRDGYLARNPIDPAYRGNLNERLACFKDGRLLRSQFEPTASGFSIVGMSGVGKSTGMKSVLSLYPQVILHNQFKGRNFTSVQIVWLRLECPKEASLTSLCLEFFSTIDDLLGTNYTKIYAKRGRNIQELMLFMTIVAAEHHIGFIVIDEIQDLSSTKSGGSSQVLNFFVKLINIIGLPVVLIGTYKAIPLMSSEFRLARRSSGQGDLIWDRMSFAEIKRKKKKDRNSDEDWPLFVETLWDLQYVKKKCPLSKELGTALYDVSYGVADIAIRIYMAAQVRAIETGDEEMSTSLLRSAYRDDFRLVNHILETLKSGGISPIDNLADVLPPAIQPIHPPVNEGEDNTLGAIPDDSSPPKNLALPRYKAEIHAKTATEPSTVKMISGRDNVGVSSIKTSKSSRKNKDINYEQDDLRGVVRRAKEANSSITAYQALLEVGFIRSTTEYL